MAIGKIAGAIKGALTDSWGDIKESVMWTSVIGGLIAGGYGGVDYAFEDWDNQANEQSSYVTQEFNKRATNINYLAKKLELLEAGYEKAEMDAGEDFTATDPEFQKYAIDKMVLDEQLTKSTQSYVTDVLLNTDITEETAKQLMVSFNEENLGEYGASFPNPKYSYALRETQAEFNLQAGLTDAEKAEKIKASLGNNEGDSLAVLLSIPGAALAFFGVAGLASGAGRVENIASRRRKKPSVKRS